MKQLKKVTHLFDRFEFGEAGRNLYNFIWDDFCDWYIEMSKETLYGDNPEAKRMNQAVLVYVLDNIVRLLHPIMPFVTEEIFSKLPTTTGSIVVASYPEVNEFSDESAAEGMEVLKEVIRAVRNIRAEVNTPLSKAVTLLIQANDEKVQAFLTANQNYIMRFL